jgi:tetratricopeptide (TPR) repeat protein
VVAASGAGDTAAVPQGEPLDLFYSYSHRDEALRMRLESHLASLRHAGVLRDWHDRRIGAGREWEDVIDDRLRSADIVLLLISADFIASDYCVNVETRLALERHNAGDAVVIPVVLKPVLWNGMPFGKLQALPRDARPVTKWRNREDAFLSVAEGIQAAAEELAARPRPPKAISRIGIAHNPTFVGRGSELESLRQLLENERVVALTGRGGVGKSQLAAELCYSSADRYPVIWWVRAEDPATIVIDLAELAAELGLPEAGSENRADTIAAVLRRLGEHGDWLLVFDNTESWDAIEHYLPDGSAGHLLLTSRTPDWPEPVVAVPLDVLRREDAARFLLQRTGQTDETGAEQLAAAADDLPLALDIAAGYVEATETPLSEYADALTHGPTQLALQAIREVPAAADLLKFAAFLAPDDIPLDLLAPFAESLPTPAAADLVDAAQLDEALAQLRRYSLAEIRGRDLSVHREIQALVRESLVEDELAAWAQGAVNVVNEAFPSGSDDVRVWPECERLLPHALEATGHVQAGGFASSETARLLNKTGLYAAGRAEFGQARERFERALAIDEAVSGPPDPNVAGVVNNLASVLHELGELRDAHAAYEQALEMREAAYGPNHPLVAVSLSNLGLLLRDLNELPKARAVLERALAIDEATYGPEHPNVAVTVNNLGLVLQDLNELTEARAAFERALAIHETVLGPDHPAVARDINSLGTVLRYLGELAEARAALERALAILESTYGHDHPTVAIAVNNLGIVLGDLDELTYARAAFERALAIDAATYGPDHPTVARDLNNLGAVLMQLGEATQAGIALERAFAILHEVLGREHPRTRAAAGLLAVLDVPDGE